MMLLNINDDLTIYTRIYIHKTEQNKCSTNMSFYALLCIKITFKNNRINSY